MLLLQKEALETHDQVERYQGLWGTEFPVKSGSLKYKYNKLADRYDSDLLVQVGFTSSCAEILFSRITLLTLHPYYLDL